jgi:hypothetical protein
MGARVVGEVYRDETTLILDFSVINSLGSATHKEVRVPLADLRTIALQSSSRAHLPRKWNAWLPKRPELVLKVSDPAALAELPAGQHGKGRLHIHPGDADAVQRLVDSIVRAPQSGPGAPRSPRSLASLDRVRQQLHTLSLGFLLTTAAGLVSAVAAGFVLTQVSNRDGTANAARFAVGLAAVVVPASVGLLVASAVQMRRLRSYRLCLVAALVAVLPWSPAWPLGLAVGVWAVVILGRRDVMLAFLGEGEGTGSGSNRDAGSHGPTSKLRSFWRSVVGYFVTTSGTPRDTRREEM